MKTRRFKTKYHPRHSCGIMTCIQCSTKLPLGMFVRVVNALRGPPCLAPSVIHHGQQCIATCTTLRQRRVQLKCVITARNIVAALCACERWPRALSASVASMSKLKLVNAGKNA